MKRALLLLVITVAFAPLLPAQPVSTIASTPPGMREAYPLTLKSEVNEVSLAFAATDGEGRVVTKLSATDVVVVDNGQLIKGFRSFRPAAEVPLNLVVLIDASGSVAAEFPRVVGELNRFFATARWAPDDRVSIIVFGGSWPTLICARSCGSAIARLPLQSIRAEGSTPLYDAIVDATKLLSRNHTLESRPALILFSDGYDTISLNGAISALVAAQDVGAAIYTKTLNSRRKIADGEAFLAQLTEGTGGLRYPQRQSVDATLSAVIQDLRSGFVLTYELPRNGAELHKVQVLTDRHPDLKIRSRTSYQVPQIHAEQSQGTP